MDKKTTKTLSGIAKKKDTSVVSSVAYGAVASATSSAGAPTSFRTNRRSSKLKTQARRSARDSVVAVTTPLELTTKVDSETLKKVKNIVKMECEQGRQQQTTVSPMEEIPPLPSTSGEIPTIPSSDEDDEEEVFPLSKAILLDETISPAVSKKRKGKSSAQIVAAKLKKKALKKARKVVVKPPLSPPALLLSTGLLEDPLPEKIPCAEKDVFKDIAEGIVSREKVEKQLLETQNKFQELLSESKTLKWKKEELLTELENLRIAAKNSADTKRDLEQMIHTSKSELEQTKLASSAELQRMRSEVEEMNKSMREIEMKNVALEDLIEKIRNQTAETVASNQEEMKLDKSRLEVAEAKKKNLEEQLVELKALAHKLAEDAEKERIEAEKKENKLQQIQKQAEEERERLKHTLIERTEGIVREQETLDKSRLEAAVAENKHLAEQLVELRSAEEKYKNTINILTSSSEIKIQELQSQVELQKKNEDQFRESVKIKDMELREAYRVTEVLRKELKETAEAKKMADKITEEIQEESETLKKLADKLEKDAEKERIAAGKKDNELQQIKKHAEEERERLNREKHSLIKRVEDAERQQEMSQNKEETMAVQLYDYPRLKGQFYNDMVSEVADGAAVVVQDKVVEQNRLFVEDVTRCIDDLKNDISSSNQDLVSRQDSHLAEALKRLANILTQSIQRGDEIQESANNMIERISKDTAKKQTEISTTLKRLEDRFVEEMEHDDSYDTDKIRLAWNLIKQSLIKKIDITYVEINKLRMAIKKSILDKEYLEAAEKAAQRAFLLLAANQERKNALAELNVGVTFYHESREIPSLDVASIDPDDLKVEVKSIEHEWKDQDIKAIKIKMSIASALFNELEAILSDIRTIAEHLANFERQSLREVETRKIVTNLEDLTASKLYQELSKFHLFASTIEDVELFKKTLRQNQPFLNIFSGVIHFLESKTDNRGIMDFLKRKGYNIGNEMVNSIDAFFFKVMGKETTEVSKQKGVDVFVSTMSNSLAIVSNLIQTINNKIDDERKQKEVRDEQLEFLKEHLLEQQKNSMEMLQRELNKPSIAMELQEEAESTMAALPSPSLDLVTEQVSHITNMVKDSHEKYSRDISNYIDSVLRETKEAYKDSLERLERQFKIAETQQLEQFQKQLQGEKEQHQNDLETQQHTLQLEYQLARERYSRETDPPPAPSFPPSSSTFLREQVEPMEKVREDAATNHEMKIDFSIEDDAAREEKNKLIYALDAAARAVSSEEKAAEGAKSGDRKIKMFLKPEKDKYVEVVLSGQDPFPRDINTEGLKEALPSTVKDSNKAPSTSKNNNTLTGKVFLDTLKDKVFPYSSKSALEDKDGEGGPALLHHPEFFRHAFLRNSTSFTEPFTFTEKSESVRSFTRLLEYSLFNDTARGTRNDNDMLSRLIYVVFEHDAKMIRYLSDIIYKFREYASRGDIISLNENRGDLLEAIIATVFSAVLPMFNSMVSRIAEAVSKPAHNDVRIRFTYSLLSLIEKFIFCASKRVHTLKNVLEKSGLVNRLSFHAASANADKVMSYDVQYDYNLLRMLLELMTINITNLAHMGIGPLKATVLSLGTFTDVNKTEETDQALIPVDKSVLSKVSTGDMDVPKTISVINYLSVMTDWYVAKRYRDDATGDKESLKEAVQFMHTLLTNNLGDSDELASKFSSELVNATPSAIVEHVSKKVLPELNTRIENIAKQTKSNDAILVKGASEVGSLGETAANMSIGMSRNHLALPWLEVDFRGGVDDSTLLWVLSGGVHSDEVVRDYQLAVPLCSSFSPGRRPAVPLHVKPLIRIINNTSGSDNVFLNNNKKTPGKEEEEGGGGGGGGDRLHIVNLAQNVSCALEYSTKDRYTAVINKRYRDGLVLVKGNVEVPRVFPTQDGKWMDNTRDNMTFTPLSVSRWKMPSASLVYGMLSKKKNKEEGQNKKSGEKTATSSVIEFMGGRAGNVFLEMLTLPSEQSIVSSTDSSMDASSTNEGLWKTNKEGYMSLDGQSMMARLISDNKRPRTDSPSSLAMVPYKDAAKIVANDHIEVYNSNRSWWIKGIQPSMRKDAAALFAVQEHLYFVLTPIF